MCGTCYALEAESTCRFPNAVGQECAVNQQGVRKAEKFFFGIGKTRREREADWMRLGRIAEGRTNLDADVTVY